MEQPVVVASAQAAAQRTLTPAELAQATETVAGSVGGARLWRLGPETGFLRRLALRGYRFLPLVEEAGQASRRGGIIDVFPPAADSPVRIELVGDRVESLRLFDPASQRSVAKVESAVVGPAREVILSPATLDELRRGLDFAAARRTWPSASRRSCRRWRRAAPSRATRSTCRSWPRARCWTSCPRQAVLVCDEPSEVAAALDELEAQALEVRAELEGKGELPIGLPLPHLTWRELEPRLEGAPQRIDLSRWATAAKRAGPVGAKTAPCACRSSRRPPTAAACETWSRKPSRGGRAAAAASSSRSRRPAWPTSSPSRTSRPGPAPRWASRRRPAA